MKAFDLSGRVAVVTGGNGGIRTETKRKRVRLNGNGSTIEIMQLTVSCWRRRISL